MPLYMQHTVEHLSRSGFTIRRICSLGLSPGWGPVRVGAHMPYMAHVGPYGPMWALMGPPGQVLEKALTFRKTFGSISHVSGPKLAFDEISKWFCIIFAGEAQKSRYFNQKP